MVRHKSGSIALQDTSTISIEVAPLPERHSELLSPTKQKKNGVSKLWVRSVPFVLFVLIVLDRKE